MLSADRTTAVDKLWPLESKTHFAIARTLEKSKCFIHSRSPYLEIHHLSYSGVGAVPSLPLDIIDDLYIENIDFYVRRNNIASSQG